MEEFYITNIHTNEETYIFGYNPADAFRRAKLETCDWRIDWVDYID